MCRWEENVRMYLKEISINTRNWVASVQDMIIGELETFESVTLYFRALWAMQLVYI